MQTLPKTLKIKAYVYAKEHQASLYIAQKSNDLHTDRVTDWHHTIECEVINYVPGTYKITLTDDEIKHLTGHHHKLELKYAGRLYYNYVDELDNTIWLCARRYKAILGLSKPATFIYLIKETGNKS